MKRIIFTGTWRLTNAEVEADVRAATREVLTRGDSIVTGGATGVDFFCMDEAMKIDPTASRLLVIVPARFESYIKDYQTNWCHEPITMKDIDILEALLRKILAVNPEAILCMPYDIITQEEYHLRDGEEVAHGDAVYAFQVNKSTGTQDTIDRAIAAGLSIELHKEYTI